MKRTKAERQESAIGVRFNKVSVKKLTGCQNVTSVSTQQLYVLEVADPGSRKVSDTPPQRYIGQTGGLSKVLKME